MSKIIPWSLPSIKGGSMGGYTPADPGDVPEPLQYYDFDNAYIKIGYSWGIPNSFGLQVPDIPSSTSPGTTITGTPITLENSLLFDVVDVNLVGVSSVTVKVTTAVFERSVGDGLDYITPADLEFYFSMDPLTKTLTYVSGNYEVTTKTLTQTLRLLVYHIAQYDFYVYDGNGTIIQTATVEVGE